MSIVRDWYENLAVDVIELVDQLVGGGSTDEQLEEVVDMAEGYGIDAMGLDDEDRAKLEDAIAELEQRITAADPRHKFVRMHDEIELCERLQRFYATGEHATYQHRHLSDTAYAGYPLYVDFDAIATLGNPDFTGQTIGDHYVEFANLLEAPDGAPDDCYAHLAIDPATTKIYLMEPSGDPELIADDLDGFLARLNE